MDRTHLPSIVTGLDTPGLGLAIGILVLSITIYYSLRQIRPGYGNVPKEFSAALRWFQRNADGDSILAWWDYAAPLVDHTTCDPVLRGPSRQIEELVDDPAEVDEWVENESVAKTAAFFLSPSLDTATQHIRADEFDYLLIARSDVLKVRAMIRALGNEHDIKIDGSDEILLQKLLQGSVQWPLAFQNEQVKVYQTPDIVNTRAETKSSPHTV